MHSTIDKKFKTLFLLFTAILFCSTSTYAVKSAPIIPTTSEVQLDEQSVIAEIEKAKGKKLNFIEKFTAKRLVKRAQKAEAAGSQKQGMAVASLITGILSVLLFWVPLIGVILAILGVVFGIVALSKVKNDPETYGGKGMALAGLICGGVGLLLTLAIIALLSAV